MSGVYEYGCEITSTSECPLREEIRAEVVDEVITLLYAKIKNKDELTTKERETNTVISLCIEQIEQLKEQNSNYFQNGTS